MNLQKGEVHLWCTKFDDTAITSEDVVTLAAEADLERSAAFAKDRRVRFLYHRTALRAVLSRYLPGIAPKDLVLRTGANNKPYVPQLPSLRFSFSDSGDVATVAIAIGHEVGVDVQAIHPVVGWQRIAARLFGAPVSKALSDMTEPSLWEAFASRWVEMEAIAKLGGEGLPLSSDILHQRLEHHHRYSFIPYDGWVGMLVSPVRQHRVRRFDPFTEVDQGEHHVNGAAIR